MKEHTIEIIKYEPEKYADCTKIPYCEACMLDDNYIECKRIRDIEG